MADVARHFAVKQEIAPIVANRVKTAPVISRVINQVLAVAALNTVHQTNTDGAEVQIGNFGNHKIREKKLAKSGLVVLRMERNTGFRIVFCRCNKVVL